MADRAETRRSRLQVRRRRSGRQSPLIAGRGRLEERSRADEPAGEEGAVERPIFVGHGRGRRRGRRTRMRQRRYRHGTQAAG